MTEAYRTQFDAFTANGGGSPEWMRPVRSGGMRRFAEVGFPGPRDEEWRFTPVSAIAQAEFVPPAASARATREDLAPFIFGHPEWPLLVVVDGRVDETLSSLPAASTLPGGARVMSLSQAMSAADETLTRHLGQHAPIGESAFTALNTAFIREGIYVHVPAGVELADPVHVVFVATGETEGTVTHPRNLIVLERAARASVIESYVTLGPGRRYFTNAVTEVVSGEGAWTEHTRIQRESEGAYHVGLTQVEQAAGSHYRSFTLAMGAAIARHNLHVRLNAPNIETLMYGLYLTRGDQVVDNHTAIYHDHPSCNSWEVYKGVLDGHSRAVFNGKVFVRPEAQKTDAKQTNRNLLLSDGARVDTKPQLEIFADDVKCTHGATVGRLDDTALFYLRSRGIDAVKAQRLLTYAFAAEVVEEVALEPVRLELERLVRERLAG
ncbi:MAG: Fe-S cluster assembly protein SufD [Gemmatimonadales bacterium]|nr:Fe-S cluster assembly protein SufD [Gemmatimonadales bacterium]